MPPTVKTPTKPGQPAKPGERNPAKSGPLPAFSAAIEKKLAAFPVVKQNNLRITLAKYERGRTSQWEERKLAEAGLIDATAALAAGLPSQASQRQFAEIVYKLFGKPTSQAEISRAVRDGLKVCVTASNGRLRVAEALRWWEAHRAGVGGSAVAAEAQDKAARQSIARRKEQIELDELERQISEKWILRETATYTFCRAFKENHFFVKRLLEKYLARDVENFAKTLNITPETVAALKSFVLELGRKVIDEIEIESDRRARGCDSSLDKTETETP
jgi:hypothetical protein